MVKKKLLSIGVDPGSSKGAIAIIDSDLNILELLYAPNYIVKSKTKQNKRKLNKETGEYEKDFRTFKWTDFQLIGNILRPYIGHDIVYTIEKVGARTGEGEKSSFIFGNSLGIFQGQFSLLNPIKYYEPTPVQWKNSLGVTADKTISIELAKKIFDMQLKDRKTKKSESDLYEALLLGFFGLNEYAKELRGG